MMTIVPSNNDILQSILGEGHSNWFTTHPAASQLPGSFEEHSSGSGGVYPSYEHLTSEFINRKNNLWSTQISKIDIQELKLHYIKSKLTQILPSVEIKTIESESSYELHFIKSINFSYLNIINSYYFLSLCTDEKNHGTYDPTCIREIYNQLNFNFNDYKIKAFGGNHKDDNHHRLVIYSAFDKLNKVFTFNTTSGLNFDELIIDKTTLINNKSNKQEIKLMITIPKRPATPSPSTGTFSPSQLLQFTLGRTSSSRRCNRAKYQNSSASPINKSSRKHSRLSNKDFEKLFNDKGFKLLSKYLENERQSPVKQENFDDDIFALLKKDVLEESEDY